MLNGNVLNSFISLTISQDIKAICQPLFETLGTEYFTFHRIYDDATTSRLSTYPEWSKRYIEQGYFLMINVDHYPCTPFNYEYIIWNDYLKSANVDGSTAPIIKESMHDFSIFNCFTMLRRYEKYCDSFTLGYLYEEKDFNNTIYLSHINFIEKFADYFVNLAADIISQVYKARLPTQYSQKYYSDSNAKNSLNLLNYDTLSFRPYINPRQFQSKLKLTSREQQCLNYFTQGLSAKETAYILGLSYRTVEYYLNNIRRKADTKKTIEITNLVRAL